MSIWRHVIIRVSTYNVVRGNVNGRRVNRFGSYDVVSCLSFVVDNGVQYCLLAFNRNWGVDLIVLTMRGVSHGR